MWKCLLSDISKPDNDKKWQDNLKSDVLNWKAQMCFYRQVKVQVNHMDVMRVFICTVQTLWVESLNFKLILFFNLSFHPDFFFTQFMLKQAEQSEEALCHKCGVLVDFFFYPVSNGKFTNSKVFMARDICTNT